jgi:N-acetylglutamate synthase-like GNAT family acetyltransferase
MPPSRLKATRLVTDSRRREMTETPVLRQMLQLHFFLELLFHNVEAVYYPQELFNSCRYPANSSLKYTPHIVPILVALRASSWINNG